MPRLSPADALPPELQEALRALKGKVPSPQLQDLVSRLCEWKPLSADDLATYLGRNRDYVHTRLIRPMLRANRLAMTLPDQPRHPEQRYTTLAR